MFHKHQLMLLLMLWNYQRCFSIEKKKSVELFDCKRIHTSSKRGEGGSGDGPGFVRCLADND